MVKLAIVGDFNPAFVPHVRTDEAIVHANRIVGGKVGADWIASSDLASDVEAKLTGYDGLWVAPGSPYRNMSGALEAIRYSRSVGLPLLGTCGGCQYVLIEFARHVLEIEDASHAEHDPYASKLVITPLSCSLVGQRMDVFVEPNTLASRAYGALVVTEEYYCNFGLNPDYEAEISDGGLRIIGRDKFNEPRILTIEDHPFFLATVFVPQLRSTTAAPHPLVVAFLNAVVKHHAARANLGRGGHVGAGAG